MKNAVAVVVAVGVVVAYIRRPTAEKYCANCTERMFFFVQFAERLYITRVIKGGRRSENGNKNTINMIIFNTLNEIIIYYYEYITFSATVHALRFYKRACTQ